MAAADGEIAPATVEEGVLPADALPIRVEKVGVGRYKIAMLDTNLLTMEDVYVEVGSVAVQVSESLVLTRDGVTRLPDRE